MLPIRLGMVNADGPQELFVYALTRKGRVETTNYRTVRLPSDVEIPVFVKDDFADFYKAMFAPAGEEGEHARRCSSSTPGTWAGATRAPPIRCRTTSCASWACSGWTRRRRRRRPDAAAAVRPRRRTCSSPACTCATTPRTSPRTSSSRRPATAPNFQGRYILRHAWTGNDTCAAADAYRRELRDAPRAGGPDAGLADRLGHQQDPAQTGPRAARRRRRPHLVAASLAVRSAR